MSRFVRIAAKAGLAGLGAFLWVAVARTAWAAPPLPTPTPMTEYGCRGCHGDTERTLSFASGEVVPVEIDLAALDSSPHTQEAMAEPVACLGCHDDEIHHRYPHRKIEEASRREFALRVSEACEGCHYPHRPFHGQEAGAETPEPEAVETADESLLPACVDCHGSHAIARVEAIGSEMPPRCLACHTDQTTAWAEEYVAPRPGFGAGDPEYAGSMRCNGCHDDKYHSWQQTLHAKLIQDPHADPSAVVGDFSRSDPDLTFDRAEVAFTIGSGWKQVYVSRPLSSTFEILPAQWNVAAQEWVPYQPTEGGTGSDWLRACGSCHVTGLETEGWTFTEFSVGCESCHGPGRAHAEDPENVKPFAAEDSQVCGACHSRGRSPEGHPFAASYRPGDTLADHFGPADESDALWPDGSARLNHQQYADWNLGSTMMQDPSISCSTCHEVHGQGVHPGQLRQPVNELCLGCHSDKRALLKHMPYHEKASQSHQFECADCHMPALATSATDYDIHNHSFLQPDPQGSIDHGGTAAMPNACNRCHTDIGEGPDWAVQMISWTEKIAKPGTSDFFGPGPTPTSPPPPTPVPGAGEGPVQEFKVRTGRWLRISFFAGAGLLAVAAVVLVVRTVSRRRQAHV